MAIQTKSYHRSSRGGVVALEVFMEYHDDDYREINDDGDPDDFRVVRWYGTNHTDHNISIVIRRGNGSKWRDVSVPPGDFSQNAGGSVKYEKDVPLWHYGPDRSGT